MYFYFHSCYFFTLSFLWLLSKKHFALWIYIETFITHRCWYNKNLTAITFPLCFFLTFPSCPDRSNHYSKIIFITCSYFVRCYSGIYNTVQFFIIINFIYCEIYISGILPDALIFLFTVTHNYFIMSTQRYLRETIIFLYPFF